MNILYLHQYFVLPGEAGGGRSYWISQEMIKFGHSVTMITSRNSQKKLIERIRIDGIDIIYIRNSYSNTMTAYRRIISFLNFMFVSSVIAIRCKKPDLVYATSTPLTIGLPALKLRLIKRVPYIFEVRDLWPEFPIQMGAVKNRSVQKLLRWFEKVIYNKAVHIIALSPGMKEGIINRGIGQSKVTVIPNMSKTDKFFPHEPDVKLMTKLNIGADKFKVIHFGAIGPANSLDYLIDGAMVLKERKCNDIEIIILGDGMSKKDIEKKIICKRLGDIVTLIGSQPMEITSEIVNLCDCSIVAFRNIPVLQTNSPNKLFDSLATGKPVIVNSAGWTKDLVEEYKCGLYVDPEKPESFADAVIFFKNNPVILESMGKNARSLAETRFNKEILCRELVEVLENVID